MSIPRRSPQKQPGTPPPRRPVPCTFNLLIEDLDPHDLTALLEALVPANEAEPATALQGGVCVCPHCGHSHGGYDHRASTLLDLALVSREALSTATEALGTASAALGTLTHVVEEEVLP